MEQGKPFRATQSPLVDFDAVCQKVRAAIEPARAHAISLHDERGDVLWLSESTMGPDEHNAVREALDAFSKSSGPPVLAFDLGDSRSAVLLRAVNGRRALVGAIMIIMDTRVIKQDDRGTITLMTSKLQRALADFAGMRPDIEPAPDAPPASGTASTSATARNRALASVKSARTSPAAAPASAPQRPATPQRSAATQRPARAAALGAAAGPLTLQSADRTLARGFDASSRLEDSCGKNACRKPAPSAAPARRRPHRSVRTSAPPPLR